MLFFSVYVVIYYSLPSLALITLLSRVKIDVFRIDEKLSKEIPTNLQTYNKQKLFFQV